MSNRYNRLVEIYKGASDETVLIPRGYNEVFRILNQVVLIYPCLKSTKRDLEIQIFADKRVYYYSKVVQEVCNSYYLLDQRAIAFLLKETKRYTLAAKVLEIAQLVDNHPLSYHRVMIDKLIKIANVDLRRLNNILYFWYQEMLNNLAEFTIKGRLEYLEKIIGKIHLIEFIQGFKRSEFFDIEVDWIPCFSPFVKREASTTINIPIASKYLYSDLERLTDNYEENISFIFSNVNFLEQCIIRVILLRTYTLELLPVFRVLALLLRRDYPLIFADNVLYFIFRELFEIYVPDSLLRFIIDYASKRIKAASSKAEFQFLMIE